MPEAEDRLRELREAAARIQWDDSAMTSSYANVCNAQGTREEVTLLFGTGNAVRGGNDQVEVKLSQRVILSPFAAKRLALLLNRVVDQYEQRFGKLDVGLPVVQPPNSDLSAD